VEPRTNRSGTLLRPAPCISILRLKGLSNCPLCRFQRPKAVETVVSSSRQSAEEHKKWTLFGSE